MRFQDKVVIVTGGNYGIGRGIAHKFGNEGATSDNFQLLYSYMMRRDAHGAIESDIAQTNKAVF